MAAEQKKWRDYVDCAIVNGEVEQAIVDGKDAMGKTRGLEFEYWVCRILKEFGEPKLDLKDRDKALYKKKVSILDAHRVDFVTYVWKPLRQQSKAALDRGLASVVKKTKVKTAAPGSEAAAGEGLHVLQS